MAIQDRERDRFVQALRREFGLDGLSLDGVLAHAAKMRKDAERYRWLRQFEVDSYKACGSGLRLDAEIDAAMAEDPAVG